MGTDCPTKTDLLRSLSFACSVPDIALDEWERSTNSSNGDDTLTDIEIFHPEIKNKDVDSGNHDKDFSDNSNFVRWTLVLNSLLHGLLLWLLSKFKIVYFVKTYAMNLIFDVFMFWDAE